MTNGVKANLVLTCSIGALQRNVGLDKDVGDLGVGDYDTLKCKVKSHIEWVYYKHVCIKSNVGCVLDEVGAI